MKITNCKVRSTLSATIKTGVFKKVNIEIPIKKVMYAFSDPLKWDEIDEMELNKETLGEIADVVFETLNTEQGNKSLAELLLKIAGKHHNQFENEMIARMLTDRNFALSQRHLLGL